MKKIMISAGEASGDVHAAAVTAALKKIESDVEVYGMGGDELRKAGGEVLFDIKDHSVMGFVEVIKKLPDIFRLRSAFIKLMEERRPDCLVVVDYPGFNMRIAAIAHEMGIPVVSYIAPSAWAWNRGRAKKVAKIVDKVACIFPFEYDCYEEAGAPVEFVGHPLLDIVHPSMPRAEAEAWVGRQSGKQLVLIVPGSRFMEIEKMLPNLLAGAKLMQQKRDDLQFAMPRANTIPMSLLEPQIKASGLDIRVTEDHNYDLFSVADLALATSGTVTLEAALCGLGSVIVYRTSALNAFIVRRVINIPHIGLPNIIAGREIMPELLQENFTPEILADTALKLLEPARRQQMAQDLAYMRQRLGEPGAVGRVAALVMRIAEGKR